VEGWACVFRFVAAKDAGSESRPLNVELMALVRREDLRGKDWRTVLTGAAFQILSARLKEGNRTPPTNLPRHLMLPEIAPSPAVVRRLLEDPNLGKTTEEDAIALAVTALPAECAFMFVITDDGHRRSHEFIPSRLDGTADQIHSISLAEPRTAVERLESKPETPLPRRRVTLRDFWATLWSRCPNAARVVSSSLGPIGLVLGMIVGWVLAGFWCPRCDDGESAIRWAESYPGAPGSQRIEVDRAELIRRLRTGNWSQSGDAKNPQETSGPRP
jgi:hypothetical protein